MSLAGHLDYAPIEQRHMAFVMGTFWESVREQPNVEAVSRQTYERALARTLRAPDTRSVVVSPSGYPDEMIGWAVAMPTCLVFAYVRYPDRRGRLGHHFGADIIGRVARFGGGVLPLAIWTRAASRMAAKGFPARYDIDEHERFLKLAR